MEPSAGERGAGSGWGSFVGLARQSAVTLATKVSITLVNIPIAMIIARCLGAVGQGAYSAAITLPNLWAGFGLCGLDAAHLYFLSKDRRALGPVVANTLLIVLCLSAILLPAYLLLLEPVTGANGAVLRPYLFLSGLIVPLVLARLMFLNFFIGLRRIETYNGWMIVSQAILLGLIAVGLLLAHRGTRYVIIAYQLSLVAFLIPAVLWMRRQLDHEDRARLRLSWPLFRASGIYGLKGHVGNIFSQFSNRFDTLLVVRWLGAGAQGYYSISVLLAEKLTLLTTSVQFVLFPRISSSSRAEADRITPIVCRNTLIWMAAGAAVLFALARFFIRLFFSNAFLPALGAMQALLPGIVGLTLSSILSSDFSGRNRRGLTTVAMGIGFGINLLLNFLWIRRLGIVGAAWASTISYTAQSVIMAIFFWRVTGISPLRLVIPGTEDIQLYRKAAERLLLRVRAARVA